MAAARGAEVMRELVVVYLFGYLTNLYREIQENRDYGLNVGTLLLLLVLALFWPIGSLVDLGTRIFSFQWLEYEIIPARKR